MNKTKAGGMNAVVRVKAGSVNLVCSDEQYNGCATKRSSTFGCDHTFTPAAGQQCNLIRSGFVQVYGGNVLFPTRKRGAYKTTEENDEPPSGNSSAIRVALCLGACSWD